MDKVYLELIAEKFEQIAEAPHTGETSALCESLYAQQQVKMLLRSTVEFAIESIFGLMPPAVPPLRI